MRWAASLHSLKLQRGLRGAMLGGCGERGREKSVDKEATPKSGLGAETTLSVVGAVG